MVNEEKFTSFEFFLNDLTQNLNLYNVLCFNLIVAKKNIHTKKANNATSITTMNQPSAQTCTVIKGITMEATNTVFPTTTLKAQHTTNTKITTTDPTRRKSTSALRTLETSTNTKKQQQYQCHNKLKQTRLCPEQLQSQQLK